MIFWWWEDALTVANGIARETGKRQRVEAFAGLWRASEVSA